MKIPKQKITLDEVYEMFEDGQLYDECTMVNRDYGKCHDYPCDDCVKKLMMVLLKSKFFIG